MTYAIILACIGLPVLIFALSRWKYRWTKQDWQQLLRVYGLVSVPFVILDMISVHRGWWSYNAQHVGGLEVGGLPVEEILFFFVVPFACLYLYSAFKKFFANDTPVFSLWLYIPLMITVGLIFGFTYTQPLERTIVDSLLLFIVYAVFVILNPRVTRALLVWLVSVILLFLVTNTFLTSIPVVLYDPAFGSSIRFGTIPLEDFAYNFSLLLGSWLVWTKAGRYPRPVTAPLSYKQ